jgi:hypothetical protein
VGQTISSVFFLDTLSAKGWNDILALARSYPGFKDFTPQEIEDLLYAASRAEHATRHKSNANIPTLGTRQELVRLGLLSNELKLEGEKA